MVDVGGGEFLSTRILIFCFVDDLMVLHQQIKKEKIMAKLPKKSKPVSKLKKSKSDQFNLFESIVNAEGEKKNEIIENVKAMLKVQNVKDSWRGLVATPPGSFLETVLECFENRTDIPLEIPFFTSLHYISHYLLKNKVYINFDNQIIKPDLWTVILGPSGSGKTFSSRSIGKMIDCQPDFPDTSSSAKFVEELVNHNNGFWLRDEFGQFLKGIETLPQYSEMKDYLLRLFDGEKISRLTKKDEYIIEDPALVILGVTVFETFLSQVGVESLVDGFSQRFNYVIAKPDPKRTMYDFPLYEISDYKEKIRTEWEKTISNVNHQEYFIKEEAKAGFITAFRLMCNIELPPSFFRRIMFRGMRYALIYHILLEKKTNILDSVDMAWAGRLCAIHLKDASELLKGHDKSDLQNLLEKTESAISRMKEKGIEISPRNLVLNVFAIKNVMQAKALLSILDH